jgi:restriction system protein
MAKDSIPSYDTFLNPVIDALNILGGSATIEELNAKVIETTKISNEQLDIIHDPQKGSQTEVEYRLAWARTYLKKYGVIENSSRGVWALTAKGKNIGHVNPTAVKRYVADLSKKQKDQSIDNTEAAEANAQIGWREELMNVLLKLDPAAFERLIQRMLRESGFIQVEVTGRSGDGGIDGKGIMRLGGLLSFHVIFQCKRYSGSVSASQVRDFRGAMVGRADKGLLITTGNFTKDATREATRDGAPAIDLIDGDQLVDKLKELTLGVHAERIEVEQITVSREWFKSL